MASTKPGQNIYFSLKLKNIRLFSVIVCVGEGKFKVKYGSFLNPAVLTADALVQHSEYQTQAHQLLKPFTYPTCKMYMCSI